MMDDPYNPTHPDFAGESSQRLPGGGEFFGRLWFRSDGCPRIELLVIPARGAMRKFRGQLNEVEPNDDD